MTAMAIFSKELPEESKEEVSLGPVGKQGSEGDFSTDLGESHIEIPNLKSAGPCRGTRTDRSGYSPVHEGGADWRGSQDPKLRLMENLSTEFRSKADIAIRNSRFPECAESCKKSVLALMEVYHLFGIKPTTRDGVKLFVKAAYKCFLRALTFCERRGVSGSWIPYFKYKLCSKFAADHGQPLPSKPEGMDPKDDPKVVLPGIYEFQEYNRLKSWQQKALSYSILMAKKGFPRASKALIKLAEEKCVKALCSKPGPDLETKLLNGFNSVALLDREGVQFQLRRTVREIFTGLRFTKEDLEVPFFPSTSANYIRSRSKLGAIGELYDGLLFGRVREFLLDFKYFEASLSQEQSDKYGPLNREEQAVLDQLFNEGQEVPLQTLGVNVDVTRFENCWKKLYWQIFNTARTERPLVQPVGLAEALKIRVISKGPPYLYTALKPLQMFMWRVLKENSIFELIGTPVTEEIIQKVIGDVQENTIDEIISGDYQASTDNLHRWVSETIASEIAQCVREGEGNEFPPVLEEMLIRSLTKHIFIDKKKKEHPQEEGQLMGSVTSFPILCIANAALCRWAMELADGRQYRVSDKVDERFDGSVFCTKQRDKLARLRVNGDDCVFRGRKAFLSGLWEDITSFAGLSSSVGKTYYSRDFCVINSVLYDLVEHSYTSGWVFSDSDGLMMDTFTVHDWRARFWVERKYINLGLLYGIKRSSGATDDATVGAESLGELHRTLSRTCPLAQWERVSGRFLRLHRETMKRYPHTPWFMPEWLGGFGLVPRSDEDRSEKDRIIAHRMRKEGTITFPVSQAAEWQMHKYVMKRLGALCLGDVRHKKILTDDEKGGYEADLSTTYQKVYKYVTIETLFCRTAQEMHVVIEGENRPDKLLRWNDDVWKMYIHEFHSSKWISPLSNEELEPFKMTEYLPFTINDEKNSQTAQENLRPIFNVERINNIPPWTPPVMVVFN
nr:RNA-dependent RNA polymerase [Flumine narna-like virus 49]